MLSVRRLNIAVSLPDGTDAELVHDVNVDLHAGRITALVGESGSGKTLTARSIPGLLDTSLRVTGGSIVFEGRDLLTLSPRALCDVRGGRIAMIFQEPMSALNPVMSLGAQMIETIRRHHAVSVSDAKQRAVAALDEVEVSGGARRLASYPHELSGGMRQRVMIAMALSGDPSILLADEPTTALDVTIQSHILDLIDRLRAERGLAVLLITHDLGIVARCADEIIVMHSGHIVERSTDRSALRSPGHPYTSGLLDAAPRLGHRRDRLGTVVPPAADDASPHPRPWWPSDVPDHGRLTELNAGHLVRMTASS